MLACFPSFVYLLEQTWQPRVNRRADDPPADDWEFTVLYNLSFLKKLLSFLLTKWRHSFLIDGQHLLCRSKKMREIHSHHDWRLKILQVHHVISCIGVLVSILVNLSWVTVLLLRAQIPSTIPEWLDSSRLRTVSLSWPWGCLILYLKLWVNFKCSFLLGQRLVPRIKSLLLYWSYLCCYRFGVVDFQLNILL